jgi:hypothetical protein
MDFGMRKKTKRNISENKNQSACRAEFGWPLIFTALFTIIGLAFF